MSFSSRYVSKIPGSDGRIAYSASERAVWARLFRAQMRNLPGRAAEPFLTCVTRLGLTASEVPQASELSARLRAATGFVAEPVPAMIEAEAFFALLDRRAFPVATFVRRPEDLEYVTEPDLFHEVFGHLPLLLDPEYADLVHRFGRAGRLLGARHHESLQRLFWFSVEFGLLRARPGELRLLGAGLLSSPREALLALDDSTVRRDPFVLEAVLACDYRIDRVQPRYFVLEDLAQLRSALDTFVARASPARAA